MKKHGTLIKTSLVFLAGAQLAACGGSGSDSPSWNDDDDKWNYPVSADSWVDSDDAGYWRDKLQSGGRSVYEGAKSNPTGNGVTIALAENDQLNKISGNVLGATDIVYRRGKIDTIDTPRPSSSPTHADGMGKVIISSAPDVKLRPVRTEDASSDVGLLYKYIDKHGMDPIYNLSIGFKSSRDELSPSDIMSVLEAVEAGKLLVVASGNDSDDKPNNFAMAPVVEPRIAKGYIIVTSDDTKLANRCGEGAERYCVTASGVAKDSGRGTSISTARVSAAAAKLFEKFPWMSNNNLVETILGTAQDIGDEGIDARYGYGKLDEEKALKGYGKFDWGESVIKIPKKDNAHFDNPITGDGGFRKLGEGFLVLNGDNSFKGDVHVDEGTLVVNGTNRADFEVGPDAELRAGDRKDVSVGSVRNGGYVTIDRSPLKVRGDYVQEGDGHLTVYLGTGLFVEGKASLDGELLLDALDADADYISDMGRLFTIVQSARGRIDGDFADVGFDNQLFEVVDKEKKNGKYNVLVQRRRLARSMSDYEDPDAPKGEKWYEGLDEDSGLLENRFSKFDEADKNGALDGDLLREAKTLTEKVVKTGIAGASFMESPQPLLRKRDKIREETSLAARDFYLGKPKGSIWISHEALGGDTDFAGVDGEIKGSRTGFGFERGFLFGVNHIGIKETAVSNGQQRGYDGDGFDVRVGYTFPSLVGGFDLLAMAHAGAFSSDVMGAGLANGAKSESKDSIFGASLGLAKSINVSNWNLRPYASLSWDRVGTDARKAGTLELPKGSSNYASIGVGIGAETAIWRNVTLRGDLGVEADVYRDNEYGFKDVAGKDVTVESQTPKWRAMAGLGAGWSMNGHNLSLGLNLVGNDKDLRKSFNLKYRYVFK